MGGDATTGQATTGSTTGGSTTGGATTGSSSTTTTYTGTLAINGASSASKEQIETATKKALASKLAIDQSKITQVTATERSSRRLAASEERRLSAGWDVTFQIAAASADIAGIDTKVTQIKSDKAALQTEMIAQLKTAGASATVADSLVVSAFDAAKPSGTTGAAATTGTTAASSTIGMAQSVFVTLLVLQQFWQMIQ